MLQKYIDQYSQKEISMYEVVFNKRLFGMGGDVLLERTAYLPDRPVKGEVIRFAERSWSRKSKVIESSVAIRGRRSSYINVVLKVRGETVTDAIMENWVPVIGPAFATAEEAEECCARECSKSYCKIVKTRGQYYVANAIEIVALKEIERLFKVPCEVLNEALTGDTNE